MEAARRRRSGDSGYENKRMQSGRWEGFVGFGKRKTHYRSPYCIFLDFIFGLFLKQTLYLGTLLMNEWGNL
jgi:hypothetical protein